MLFSHAVIEGVTTFGERLDQCYTPRDIHEKTKCWLRAMNVSDIQTKEYEN